jgi:hypothetical protein
LLSPAAKSLVQTIAQLPVAVCGGLDVTRMKKADGSCAQPHETVAAMSPHDWPGDPITRAVPPGTATSGRSGAAFVSRGSLPIVTFESPESVPRRTASVFRTAALAIPAAMSPATASVFLRLDRMAQV